MEKDKNDSYYHEEYSDYDGSLSNQQSPGGMMSSQQNPEGSVLKTSSAYLDAQKRVKKLKGFYTHAFFYVLINGFFMGVNILSGENEAWFQWPMMGWGIGLASHAFSVFGKNGRWGKDWEQKKIKEFMEKERAKEQELLDKF